MQQSIFIVLDGIDGSGTSTHSKLLAGFLSLKGLKTYSTQEPSNSDIGKLLRTYLKNDKIPASTDALLFAADRVLHYNNDIKEKLEKGYTVISDRYLESSIAYQSSQSENISVEWVLDLNKFAGKPDLTIILDIDPKMSLARKQHKVLDKYEETTLLDKVRQVYLNRAKDEGYFVIYTDDIIEIVQSRIQNIVIEKLVQKGIQFKK
ncbi:MAG: dTMP kinase [Candidatus Lokiarchaeota archaeon]|nr:dTMP kinase [Candidatus Lokiarchaeota archaeon]